MKRLFIYLITIVMFVFIMPVIGDAANYSISGSTSSNVGTYEIKYVKDEIDTNEVTFKIDKPNDGLSYSIEKGSTLLGDCYNSDLSCTIKTADGNIADGTILAILKIINDTIEDKTSTIAISGIDSTKINISIPKKEEATTKVLSNDATLSGITLSGGTMEQAFSKDIMEYSVTGIKDTINSITVTPNCDNNCNWSITCPTGGCSVSNTRKVTLQNGANKIAINVTSEDGSANKTYILNIYRGEVVTSSAYLEELKIKDGKLSPNFDSMTNDYSITVGLDVEKLDIITTTEDPNAEVVIKGNDKLVEGENTITITVTSSDGENKQVYTILVTKEALEDEEDEKEEKIPTTKVEKKKNNTWLIILLSLLGLGLIIVVFLIIFKKKKKKNKNDKNDKNNKSNGNKIEEHKSSIEDENTETLNILKETRESMYEEPKQDIDEALDDLMQTKRLELGDLNF